MSFLKSHRRVREQSPLPIYITHPQQQRISETVTLDSPRQTGRKAEAELSALW